MTISKNVLIMIVLATLVLYSVANVILWHKTGSFHYVDTDHFIIVTFTFVFMIIFTLPRTVLILLGAESQPPRNEIDESI
jgi:hypothetical protein